MGGSKKEQSLQDSLQILTTQIETINQQLAGGGGGGGGSPALLNAVRDVSGKLAYMYQGLQGLQAGQKGITQAVATQLGTLQQHVAQPMSELIERVNVLQQSFNGIAQALRNSPAINAQDIGDIKQTIHELAAIYKEEAEVFRLQNEFLQKKILSIEARLDTLTGTKGERREEPPNDVAPGKPAPKRK